MSVMAITSISGLFQNISLMKKVQYVFLTLIILTACGRTHSGELNKPFNPVSMNFDSTEMTNNFYDKSPTYALPLNDITVEGEVENPGKVDFSRLARRSVIVKEALLDSAGNNKFTGAYRYDGYSLFDILDKFRIKKANAAEYSSVIDLYVEIENKKGDKVIFSWGEIYYPINLHKILIACSVSRIVPSKTKDLWELPAKGKLVSATDLITERNISDPVRITVRSYRGSFSLNRGITPLYSPSIRLFADNRPVGKIVPPLADFRTVTYNTVFYGRGKGIHSTSPFTGILMKEILLRYYPVSKDNLKSSLLCLEGIDGYRCVVSYSELFNRNDQQEFLLVTTDDNENGGKFRIFPACDFFSDRAIKSLDEIRLDHR